MQSVALEIIGIPSCDSFCFAFLKVLSRSVFPKIEKTCRVGRVLYPEYNGVSHMQMWIFFLKESRFTHEVLSDFFSPKNVVI